MDGLLRRFRSFFELSLEESDHLRCGKEISRVFVDPQREMTRRLRTSGHWVSRLSFMLKIPSFGIHTHDH